MLEIQDKNVFAQNLRNNKPELTDLVNNSDFYFKDAGTYAFYYDRKDHAWNQQGLIVILESTQMVIQKWKDIWEEHTQYLKNIFTDALDSDSKYDVVDLKFKVVNDDSLLVMSDELLSTINEISTRDALFTTRPVDEKLELLNNTIEKMLKRDGKFISIGDNYFNLLTNENIRKYRNQTQPFRHASQQALDDRKSMSLQQKEFLVNYGVLIVVTISESNL